MWRLKYLLQSHSQRENQIADLSVVDLLESKSNTVTAEQIQLNQKISSKFQKTLRMANKRSNRIATDKSK